MFVSRLALVCGMLLAPPKGEEGGAGGGGAGGDDGKGGAAATELTEAQLGQVAQVVNSAITGHLDRKLPKAIEGALAGLKLDEKLAEAVAKLAPPKPEEGAAGGAGTKEKEKETALEKRVRELNDKLEASEAARLDGDKQRAKIEEDRRYDAGVSQLTAALSGKMKDADALRDAVNIWTKVDGRLKVSEDGTATFRVKKAPYKGAPEEDTELPLADALPLLLASKDAARFLPAPGAGTGSGAQKGRTLPAGTSSGAGSSSHGTGDDPMSKTVRDLEARGVDLEALLD